MYRTSLFDKTALNGYRLMPQRSFPTLRYGLPFRPVIPSGTLLNIYVAYYTDTIVSGSCKLGLHVNINAV